MAKLTLRKAMVCMTVVVMIVVAVLSFITISITSDVREGIQESRALVFQINEEGQYTLKKGNSTVTLSPSETTWKPLSRAEQFKYDCCNVLMVALPVIYVVGGILFVSVWFYRRKIKEPLLQMQFAIDHIAANDLDFTLTCKQNDELGSLCKAMECMRQELVSNQTRMWAMTQEQKTLNASVAHDLRTPITVMKGYLDYLMSPTVQDNRSNELLDETLSYMKESVGRMEEYVDGVRKVQKLDEITLKPEKVSVTQLISELTSNVNRLGLFEKQFEFINQCTMDMVNLDTTVFFRVMENLLTNAIKYSKHRIVITIRDERMENHSMLFARVEDDGNGFSDEVIKEARHPYFTTDGEREHYGLGLWISSTLCEIHGGSLQLSNGLEHGGVVNTSFLLSKC